jgi:hypothetical protein
MLQNHSIDRDLHIVIGERQGEIEKNRDLVEDSKENGEGSAQCEMDESEEEN